MKTIYAGAIFALLASCSQASNGTGITGANANGAPAAITSTASARPLLTAVPVDGLPTLGDADALVTVVEFTDYECPYCQRAEQTMRTLRGKYGADLRFAIAENPLPMHEHAREAALSALSVANADDSQFERAHALLFDHPAEHSSDDLAKLGDALGLGRSYESARASSAPADALAHSMALATSVHARGTPTFFINGRKVKGAQPLEVFDKVIAEELAHAHDLVSGGTRRADVYSEILDEARAHPAPLDDDEDSAPTFNAPAKAAGGALLYGNANATTTAVLFTDFECPYCARLDARLRELVATHPDVRVVLRNHPLPMHTHARDAAKAAIAADAQGKLGALAPILFAHQAELDRASLTKYAAQAGLDVARFAVDMDSNATAERLEEDESIGDASGVKGTPTTFFEGFRVIGAQPIPKLEDALTRAKAR